MASKFFYASTRTWAKLQPNRSLPVAGRAYSDLKMQFMFSPRDALSKQGNEEDEGGDESDFPFSHQRNVTFAWKQPEKNGVWVWLNLNREMEPLLHAFCGLHSYRSHCGLQNYATDETAANEARIRKFPKVASSLNLTYWPVVWCHGRLFWPVAKPGRLKSGRGKMVNTSDATL